MYSDGSPWRPVVHVQDVARAFRAVLEARAGAVHAQAFNVGVEDLNYQIIGLAGIGYFYLRLYIPQLTQPRC